jgi:hypothetical protein
MSGEHTCARAVLPCPACQEGGAVRYELFRRHRRRCPDCRQAYRCPCLEDYDHEGACASTEADGCPTLCDIRAAEQAGE